MFGIEVFTKLVEDMRAGKVKVRIKPVEGSFEVELVEVSKPGSHSNSAGEQSTAQ